MRLILSWDSGSGVVYVCQTKKIQRKKRIKFGINETDGYWISTFKVSLLSKRISALGTRKEEYQKVIILMVTTG